MDVKLVPLTSRGPMPGPYRFFPARTDPVTIAGVFRGVGNFRLMDIPGWLSELGLDRYVEDFEENAIDFETLELLTDDDLKELGIAALGHRKKLLAAIARLGDAAAPQPVPEIASEAAVASPGGERRQVTVLFADISAFTKMSTELDPEETSALLNRYFGTVDDTVQSFGGSIDKHIGDAVMAVFGAPVAHSNDPERAVRAALEIHQAIQQIEPPITVHIGIASGQVVASDIGSDSHQEYTITGDSVNLASRLQDLAKSGETFLSDAVRQDLAAQIECEEICDVSIQGLAETVTVWRLRKFHAAGEVASQHAFVGRNRELRQFQGALEDCRETGRGQTIYVRGEAGIGKTRLIEEFQAIAGQADFRCHKSMVLDFGVGKGQDAVRLLIRSLLDLPAGSDKRRRGEAAARAIAEGLIAAERQVYLNDLLDLPQPTELRAIYDAMDNVNRNRGKQETMAELVAGLSAREFLLINIEDIHWADSIVLAHAGSLAAAVSNCRAMLLLTSRVEGDPIDQNWRSMAPGASLLTMDLNPLREDEALSLAGEFFEASSRFARSCIERAEGNPMFLEQLLRSAEELSEGDVPGSVQSIVLSRMDNLEPLAKQALQAASVIGHVFQLDLLRHLIDSAQYTCSGLVEHLLVRPQDGNFHFAHALIRDGVYSSLLRSTRRELHQKAAEWFADRDTTLRAQHLDRAESPIAADAYADAALSHAKLFHFEKALELVGRGKELAQAPETRHRIFMLEGECLREAGRPADSIEVYRQALAATEDDVARCRAWIGLAAGMRVTDDYTEALDALSRAEEVARDNGLGKELSEVHYYRGNLYFPLANIEGCLTEHRKALEAAEGAGLPEGEARALSGLGDAYYSQGRMITSLEYFRRCMELSRTHGFGRIAVGNAYMVPWNRVYLTEMVEARKDAMAAVEGAVQVGHQRAEMVAQLTAARVLLELGELDGALSHVDRGLELAEFLGANRFKPFLMIHQARAQFAQSGHQPKIVSMIETAVELSRETGIGFLGPWTLSTLALVHPEPAPSRSALAEGEKLLESDCVGHNYYAFYRDAMEVSLRLNDWQETERYALGLENYTRNEPLPWSDFTIQRARALALHGQGETGAALVEELKRLQRQADAAAMVVAKQALDAALAA